MTSSLRTSGRELVPISDAESQLSSLIIDEQICLETFRQGRTDNMLKMISCSGVYPKRLLHEHPSEIDQNSAGIMEEIDKSKDAMFQRKKSLEEEKDHFQKTAFAVLDMLNGRNLN